jgi:hypothetical protein
MISDQMESEYPFIGVNSAKITSVIPDSILWTHFDSVPNPYKGNTNILVAGNGVYGQGHRLPSVQAFDQHRVVVVGSVESYQLGKTVIWGSLYDPSYGRSYSGTNAVQLWQMANVDGFYFFDPDSTNVNFWAAPASVKCPVMEIDLAVGIGNY